MIGKIFLQVILLSTHIRACSEHCNKTKTNVSRGIRGKPENKTYINLSTLLA